MEFLGVGYQEILLVLVLLLVVVGPDRLPNVAYQLGRAVREMQKYARAVRDEFGEEMEYIQEQYDTIRGDIDTARQEIRQQGKALDAELKSAQAEFKSAQKELDAAIPEEVRGKNVVSISSASTARKPAAVAAAAESAATGTDGAPAASKSVEAGSAIPSKETPEKAKDGPPLMF